jgi:mRNA interferase YafQ
MLIPEYAGQFKKEYKLAIKRGLDTALIDSIITDLINEIPLDEKYKDHALTGNLKDYRECHIKPDWLLTYRIADGGIYFSRTGTHSDIFNN